MVTANTKTTLLLSETLRRRLKAVAARTGRTVTDLIVEGAERVLERYERAGNRDAVIARAKSARQQLREGLFKGPGLSDRIDQVLYAAEPDVPYGKK